MNTLFLHLPVQGEECRIFLSGPHGLTDLGKSSAANLAKRYPDSACVVFLPSSQCLFTSVTASAKQLRQASQSLSWLIEEQAGEDVDNLQVIAGPTQGVDETPILAIAKTTLQEHLTRLHDAGLHVIAAIPDLVLLPRDESDWQLCAWEHDVMALRTGVLSGAVLETSMLELMLEAAILERPEQTTLTFSVAIADASLRSRVQIWAAQYPLIELDFAPALSADAVLSAHTDWVKHPANFLQGSFALTKRFALPNGLRMAAMFIAVAFSVQVFSEWIYYGYYKHQASKVGESVVASYKSIYTQERLPATNALTEVQKRMKGHANEIRSDASLLPLLTRVAEAVHGSGLSTQRVDFSGGVLTLDVDVSTLGALDSFKQRLESQGFQAQIVSASAQGSAIRGRLRVESRV